MQEKKGPFNKNPKEESKGQEIIGMPMSKTSPKTDEGLENTELEQMLKRISEMQGDLEQKMNKLQELGKSRNIDIDKYLSYVTNFTFDQQKQIKEKERELDEQIKNAIPAEACINKLAKSKDQLSKERRGKTRGARQNWIPMR